MDCCDLAATAVIGCLVLAAIVVLIAFNYAFKGRFGNKEVSAKPATSKTTPPKRDLKFETLPTKNRKKGKFKNKTTKRKR